MKCACIREFKKEVRIFPYLFILFIMCMIVNVVFAVAVIAVAAAAVAELQLRIGHIGSAADRTLVGIGLFDFCGCCLVRACSGEGYSACFFARFLFKYSAGIDPPGLGDHIHHILTKEQEVVGDGYQREQTVGEQTVSGKVDYINYCQHQINQRKDPGLDRDDEKQQEAGIGLKCRITQ